jgi:integrase
VLAHTGCRISEALALTADRVDMAGGLVVFETLKKRRRGIFRAVPVPPDLLDALELVHGITEAQRRPDGGSGRRLWPWSRTTAWRRVQEVMHMAGIEGPQASSPGSSSGSTI